jgi:uncharacterized protein
MEDNPQNADQNKISFVEKYNIPPLLFAFIALFVVFFLYQIVGGLISLFFLGDDLLNMDINIVRLTTGLGQILLILIPTFFLAKLEPFKFKDIFKINKISFLTVISILIGTISLQEVLQILLIMQEQIPLPEGLKFLSEFRKTMEQSYDIVAQASSYSELSYVILIIALIPAFCEELLFRGLLQHNFVIGLGTRWGIILCGIIFGAFHFNLFGIIPLILLGIYLGFLVYRSGSIFASIICHFTNNFVATLSYFYLSTEDPFLKDTSIEITIEQLPGLFILFTASLLIFLASLYLFIKETSKIKTVIN